MHGLQYLRCEMHKIFLGMRNLRESGYFAFQTKNCASQIKIIAKKYMML